MSKEKTNSDSLKVKEGFRLKPMDFLSKKSHIEIEGNTLATLEGSKGVLEYSTECIRIAVDSYVVSFSGRGLKLRCISPTSLTIEGSVLNISFSD